MAFEFEISISSTAAAAYHIFPTPWAANRIHRDRTPNSGHRTKCSVDRSIPGVVGDEGRSEQWIGSRPSSGAKWAFTFTILVVVTVTQDSVMMNRFTTLHETIVRVFTAIPLIRHRQPSSVESNQLQICSPFSEDTPIRTWTWIWAAATANDRWPDESSPFDRAHVRMPQISVAIPVSHSPSTRPIKAMPCKYYRQLNDPFQLLSDR
jgi:hypothetical protein